MGKKNDAKEIDKKYCSETFDSVEEWDSDSDNKMQVDQAS